MTETVKAMHEQHCGCDVTKRIIRPDGEIRYVRWVGIPVVEDGVFRGFHGTTMDVTEQELLTRELRREQAYFSDAQGMAHIGSLGYNLITQKLLHSSDENARLYGFDPSQGPIPAERFFATQHAEGAPLVNAVLERAVREGTDFYLDEYRIHHTDGSIRFLRAIGHRNATGEPGEYVGVTMDITERKRAEEERERLRQLEAELEHINRVNMMGEPCGCAGARDQAANCRFDHERKRPPTLAGTRSTRPGKGTSHGDSDRGRRKPCSRRYQQSAVLL
jgi:PAS domain-containing protein